MKSPGQLFRDLDGPAAKIAADAIASDAVQRAMTAAFSQYAWTLHGDEDARAKLDGARAVLGILNSVGVPPIKQERPRTGLQDDWDKPSASAGKGTKHE